MIVEYVRYRIDAERHGVFVRAYGEALTTLRESPYCLGYELSRCTETPDHFVLRIEWTSEDDHLRGFRKSPLFRPFLQAVSPFFKNLEEMRHYAPTDLQWVRDGEPALAREDIR
jgi:quinol monooxygenase YgiN